MADWITTTEAVALSGYHIDYIRKLIKAGKVKGQKWGQQWQVSRSSLLTHIAKTGKLGAKRGPKTEA
jgi:excisionase family DNA binding protein